MHWSVFLNGLPLSLVKFFHPPSLQSALFIGCGKPPAQEPSRLDVTNHGAKVTLVLTLLPEPGPTRPGPLVAPHQLQVPLATIEAVFTLLMPKALFPERLLRL